MDVRQSHQSLGPTQKANFVAAVLKLKNKVDSVLNTGNMSRYDDFVQVHKNAMMGPDMFMPMPHGGPLFFPWHRVVLRQFELALQTAMNDTSITLPYWDWNLAGTDNPFTDDFLGGDGDRAQNNHVTTGPFAGGGNFAINVWDSDSGDPALRRDFGDDPTAYLPTASQVASAIARVPYSPGAGCWEVTCEGGLHNPVHRWIAGNMADATSPNDPVFFLHHCYIDLLWERWKKQHPSSAPYLPVADGNGMDLTSTLVFNRSDLPAPWTGYWTVKDVIDPGNLGYSYG